MKAMLFALAIAVAGPTLAQSRSPTAADAAAKAPQVQYRSAFDGYRRFVEEKVADWRKANEEVRAAGGHKGHLSGGRK